MQADSLPAEPSGKLYSIVAPPSMEFSRQEYWSELAFPSPGDLHDPGIKPGSPTLQVDSVPLSYHSIAYIPIKSFLPKVALNKEKEMATHSSILAWRIPWTEEPGGWLSIESYRVRLH